MGQHSVDDVHALELGLQVDFVCFLISNLLKVLNICFVEEELR